MDMSKKAKNTNGLSFSITNILNEATSSSNQCELNENGLNLISSRQSAGSRSNNGHPFSGPDTWRNRFDPPHGEGLVNDGTLDVLDGDGRLVDAQHARSLAWGRANTTRKFREIVGL